MKFILHTFTFCSLLVLNFYLDAFNRSLFYRVSSFWGEPRFERPWLTTVDVQLSGGSQNCGRNTCREKVNILSIYGPESLATLVPLCAKEINLFPEKDQFTFKAVADLFQADINIYQNFTCGFFTHFHFPIINLDLFPSWHIKENGGDEIPSRKNAGFKGKSSLNLSALLATCNLALEPVREAALSDSTLFFGWTHSYENTTYLDFIDFTAKTGVLFPTGKGRNENLVLDIPLGYNGHWGIPLSGDISCGAYDWITLGIHADAVFFFKKNDCIRMKLDSEAPTGFITLGKREAMVTTGPVWRAGAYFKADHFYSGLSFLVAFSYEQKNRTVVCPIDQETFSVVHVNRDQRFKKWSRAFVNMMAEFDFSDQESSLGPRVSLFYNHQISGKRVFSINTVGSSLGLEVNWSF